MLRESTRPLPIWCTDNAYADLTRGNPDLRGAQALLRCRAAGDAHRWQCVPCRGRCGHRVARARGGVQARAVFAAPRAPGGGRQRGAGAARCSRRALRGVCPGAGRDGGERLARYVLVCMRAGRRHLLDRRRDDRHSACRASARAISVTCRRAAPAVCSSGSSGCRQQTRTHPHPREQHQPDSRRGLPRARAARRAAASRSPATAWRFSCEPERLDARRSSSGSCASAAAPTTSTTPST